MLYLLAYALGGRIRIDDLRRLPERAQMALRLEPRSPSSRSATASCVTR